MTITIIVIHQQKNVPIKNVLVIDVSTGLPANVNVHQNDSVQSLTSGMTNSAGVHVPKNWFAQSLISGTTSIASVHAARSCFVDGL